MQDDLKELISIVAQQTGLSESIIEKDYHVTHAIKVLSEFKNKYFELIFAGGTCLVKGHKIIKRMSEDVDFKIGLTSDGKLLSRSQLRKEISKFRKKILLQICSSGFIHDENKLAPPQNEGRNVQFHLIYESLYPKADILRPSLQIELTQTDVNLPTTSLNINTLIQEVLSEKVSLETCEIECISLDETLAEKWVALTRRVSAIERGKAKEDDTLIRHLYDIAAVKTANRITNDFYKVALITISQDAEQFKSQHQEYFENPAEEIKRSVQILEKNPYWKNCFDNFVNNMIYEREVIFDFEEAMKILKELSINVTNKVGMNN